MYELKTLNDKSGVIASLPTCEMPIAGSLPSLLWVGFEPWARSLGRWSRLLERASREEERACLLESNQSEALHQAIEAFNDDMARQVPFKACTGLQETRAWASLQNFIKTSETWLKALTTFCEGRYTEKEQEDKHSFFAATQ